MPQVDVDADAPVMLADEDMFAVQAVVENDDSKWHDYGTVQLDNRVRLDADDEHGRSSSSSLSEASPSGSIQSENSGDAPPVVSDVEAQCQSDADLLDVDDYDQCLSPPMSRCDMSVVSGYGDTSSWTQDDDSASSTGNDLLRQLEAYTHGDDRSLDEFVVDGCIPALKDYLAPDSQEGDEDGSLI